MLIAIVTEYNEISADCENSGRICFWFWRPDQCDHKCVMRGSSPPRSGLRPFWSSSQCSLACYPPPLLSRLSRWDFDFGKLGNMYVGILSEKPLTLRGFVLSRHTLISSSIKGSLSTCCAPAAFLGPRPELWAKQGSPCLQEFTVRGPSVAEAGTAGRRTQAKPSGATGKAKSGEEQLTDSGDREARGGLWGPRE